MSLSDLVLKDPAVRKSILDSLAARKAKLQAEIVEIENHEQNINEYSSSTTEESSKTLKASRKSAKNSNTSKKSVPSFREKIISVLSKEKNGLTCPEIADRTGINKSTIYTLISIENKKNKGSIVKTQTDDGRMVYLLGS